ncbi:TetR/AcrR family transcriptional regulator [Zhihengliuella alba]|uniref:TetR/AcrR family transcriptional regulator n=1 Tax=Zhihengliuella alba TaxID=547018 RepID=A0ABP7CVM6_9MICC
MEESGGQGAVGAGAADDGARRPARLPRAQRRAQLLEAAHRVFVANGYHGAAMDDIADRAQVSKPVLYQHFPGKRELYLALIDQHLAVLTEAMVEALRSTADNKERVNAAIRTYFDFVAADHQAHRLVFESDLLNDDEVSARFDEFNARIADEIAHVIAGDTNLDEARALLLGRSLSGMAQVAARAWLEVADQVDLDEASELVARLAWRGIGRFPKES